MNMKTLTAASLAVMALSAPVAAHAQTGSVVTPGAYANLNLGYADGGQTNYTTVGGRLGYRLNDWIGVEGELATGLKGDTNRIAGVDVKSKLKHEAAAYVVGFAPLSANTDLFARVGYGTTKIRAKALGISGSDSAESWNVGVGAQHHFDGVNGVRVDYTRQEFNDDMGHANVWTVGYTRRF